MSDRSPDFLTSRAKSPAHRLEHAVTAFQAADGGARNYLNVGKGVSAVDQIARHRLREISSTHQHPDFDPLTRQVNSSLAGRVTRTHQYHFLISAQLRLYRRCPVVHA